MQVAKPVGRNAAVRKYDILSALMAHALSGDKHRQRQVLRLMSLITTRYNWQRDELAMGQTEIARLWSVNERTVKREMAKFRALGWLRQKQQAARSRVAVYGISFETLLETTRPDWDCVGPDLIERLSGTAEPPTASNVVPLRAVPKPGSDGSLWAEAQAHLHESDPATYANWFHHLAEVDRDGARVILAAPSSFHASHIATHLAGPLLAALRRVDPAVSSVSIEA